MSLCDQYEQTRGPAEAPEAPVWTPEEREAMQTEIVTRWLALRPCERNKRLDAERTRLGYPIPAVPTHPLQRKLTLTHRGETHTVAQWGLIIGWSDAWIYQRLKAGWPLEQILVPKPVALIAECRP